MCKISAWPERDFILLREEFVHTQRQNVLALIGKTWLKKLLWYIQDFSYARRVRTQEAKQETLKTLLEQSKPEQQVENTRMFFNTGLRLYQSTAHRVWEIMDILRM